ncbi:MAG TPA: 50S ribosomal protein L21 [Thermodesulfovibrio thiophilus]|uniref:50S ribosomal protein L21 n=1 Tax=Thermodesulfovibrio thiophilus TaxID=340095 RepID=UPI001826A434|nr:50S ribosomal protein L21 [Thermodesulfovibrio thiophilus]HHW19777.1 50S ribosomal protein L21 [Thermodesulfovibrio thiophilus]HOA83495.1 50S ribosomal protein L21 [Thermodesulfovibrio thiophilus]HQD36657.1 50S ribosomal protein L21 [Thermodesulfovibrio thiophilus]
MYAVIETGGKQLKVKAGDTVKVEKLSLEPGQEVVFDKILLFKSDDELKVGKPYLEGIKVKAQVIDEAKDKKVLIYRPPSKKAIHKLKGHRQWYTKIKVLEIIGG